MKALYTTVPGEYGFTDRPVPAPAADEALVKVAAVGLCPNELRIRDGIFEVEYPVIPGHQFAGTVESVGCNVNYIQPGHQVAVHPYVTCGECRVCRSAGPTHDCERFKMLGMTLDGGFAEYCAVPARHLYKLPNHVMLEEGALIENLANAVAAVRNTELQPGERVCVIGSWSMAMCVVQVARMYSPTSLVLVGTGESRLTLAEKLGASAIVDLNADAVRNGIFDAMGGHGADAVLVCEGGTSEVQLAMDVVATSGRIVVDGHVSPTATVEFAPIPLLVSRGVSLRGNRGFMTPDYTRAHGLLSEGIVEVNPLITYTYTLSNWKSAFRAFTDPAQQTVQVLITP